MEVYTCDSVSYVICRNLAFLMLDLVSYLLHHPSARCVTFKELFKCKSTNKTGDKDKISLIFSPYFCGLFRKSGFVRRYTIAQKDFGRPYADYRISGEKGFASRLNERLSFQTYDARPISFCAYAKEVLLRIFRGLFLFCCSFEP